MKARNKWNRRPQEEIKERIARVNSKVGKDETNSNVNEKK